MLVQLVRSHRQGHPDVQLRDRDVQPERSELLDVLLDRARDGAHDQVRLHPDAVERHALGEQRLGEREHSAGFGARALDVVVVDVQLGAGVGGTRGAEGDVDECAADGVVEHGRPEGAVLVEGLFRGEGHESTAFHMCVDAGPLLTIDNIPGICVGVYVHWLAISNSLRSLVDAHIDPL